MGFLDRLLGREEKGRTRHGDPYFEKAHRPPSTDEQAIARYKYLLRTAPPQTVEQAHAEAFAQLSAEQRRQVLTQLSSELSEHERPATDEPRDLARAATRAEMRRPGYLPQAFGGPSVAAMATGSMLGTISGLVIGTAIASTVFGGYDASPEAQESGDEMGSDAGDLGAQGDDGTDTGGDFGSGDAGWDAGGFGGGDFGGI